MAGSVANNSGRDRLLGYCRLAVSLVVLLTQVRTHLEIYDDRVFLVRNGERVAVQSLKEWLKR